MSNLRVFFALVLIALVQTSCPGCESCGDEKEEGKCNQTIIDGKACEWKNGSCGFKIVCRTLPRETDCKNYGTTCAWNNAACIDPTTCADLDQANCGATFDHLTETCEWNGSTCVVKPPPATRKCVFNTNTCSQYTGFSPLGTYARDCAAQTLDGQAVCTYKDGWDYSVTCLPLSSAATSCEAKTIEQCAAPCEVVQ